MRSTQAREPIGPARFVSKLFQIEIAYLLRFHVSLSLSERTTPGFLREYHFHAAPIRFCSKSPMALGLSTMNFFTSLLTGLIVIIGKLVLMTACTQNVVWQHMGLPHP
jgi:hypothetical protein